MTVKIHLLTIRYCYYPNYNIFFTNLFTFSSVFHCVYCSECKYFQGANKIQNIDLINNIIKQTS